MSEEQQTANKRKRLIIAGEIGLLILIVGFLIFGRNWDTTTRFINSDEVVTDVEIASFDVDSSDAVEILSPADIAGAVQVGEAAPNFTLGNTDGEQMTLSEMQGQPVIINFWATWCPPCREEMPELQETFEAYADNNLEMLAINKEESKEKISKFFVELSAEEEIEFTFPSLLDGQGDVSKLYGVFSVPTTFFVDANGIITAVHFGQLNREQIDGYLADTLATSTN